MKKILWLLVLLPGIAAGQIYIDSYKFAAPASSGNLILDSIPGALVAYSLRKLDKDYTGNVLTIRKDNGDTLNVGFSGDYIDTVAIKNHCGTGAGDSCRVRRWYDQSGNGRNLFQGTTIYMPLIGVNGVLMRSNGDVCIDFVSSFLKPEAGEVKTQTSLTYFFALVFDVEITNTMSPLVLHTSIDTVGLNSIAFGPVTGQLTDEREAWTRLSGATVYGVGQTANNVAADDYIYTYFAPNTSGGVSKIYKNNSTLTLTTTAAGDFGDVAAPRNFGRIGANTDLAAAPFNGKLYEIIAYASNKDADVNQINTNINTFYSIY